MQQGDTQWKATKLGVISGTRFKAAMGRKDARETLALTIVAEILTQSWEDVNGRALEWGSNHESEAREAYVAATMVDITEVPIVFHPDTPFVAVSPDGLVAPDGLIEIKCPYTSKEHVRHMASGLPRDYVPQVQGQLWVTGRQWTDFVSYDPRMPEHLRLNINRIERDEDYIRALASGVMEVVERVQAILSEIGE